MRRLVILVLAAGMLTSFLAGANIQVQRPRQGETFRLGTTLPVRWTATGITGTVVIAVRDLDRQVQYNLVAGIPATAGTYSFDLKTGGGEDAWKKTGRYLVKVVQGKVVGKSGEFRLTPAADAEMIPRRPGNPVYHLQNPGGNVIASRSGIALISGPKILKLNAVGAGVTYPGTITLEYETVGADQLELIRYDIHNLPESPPIWTSSSLSGRIVFSPSMSISDSEFLYRVGELTRDFNLIARKGSKSDERRVSVKIKPKYLDVVVSQAQIDPVEGPWGAEASFRYDFSNALLAKLEPLHADPADPHGKQSLQISGNNGARVYGVEKIRRHAGAQWRLLLLRRDNNSWATRELYSATTAPQVKRFSLSPAKLSGPGVVTFSVGFAGAESADLVDVAANRVLHTFPGQRGGEVSTTYTFQVTQSKTFQLRLKRFSTVVRSSFVDVTVENRPLGGYNINIKREGGIFPSPNTILEYEVYGQEFIKFYYQSAGDPDPRTLIKEFTGLNGAQNKGSFKHRPAGFPARYKVIMKDTNGMLQIQYYTAR